MIVSLTFVGALVGAGIYNDSHDTNKRTFERMSPSEHLRRAREACGFTGDKSEGKCLHPSDAYTDLWAVPQSAPEYGAASKLLASIQQQARDDEGAPRETTSAGASNDGAEAQSAEFAKTREQAFEKMQRNTSGEAHDGFTCATSTENKPIMSFDNGQTWWLDDGRCAAQL
jgi:hypothetical protein